MRWVLLLRGINVGGKNRVVMAELKNQLTSAGLSNAKTYINSGNIVFDSDLARQNLVDKISQLLAAEYEFAIPFSLISSEALLAQRQQLPDWWNETMARRDVLFYTDAINQTQAKECVESMSLHKEEVYIGNLAIFWGHYSQTEFLKSAYHKNVAKSPMYKAITIRNANTFDKLCELVSADAV